MVNNALFRKYDEGRKKRAPHNLELCGALLSHILNFQAVITQINVTLILLNNLISAFFAFLTG
ncbi:hypothetical protein EBA29_01052 [Bacillus velezensis]|nr:hypothetical protein EBA29_01052 [Bacillus velezensis]SLB86113.1 Uncharacterised protein [Mycobacteroides abscessus subsp. massiliense]